jgi:hypothetical protein
MNEQVESKALSIYFLTTVDNGQVHFMHIDGSSYYLKGGTPGILPPEIFVGSLRDRRGALFFDAVPKPVYPSIVMVSKEFFNEIFGLF